MYGKPVPIQLHLTTTHLAPQQVCPSDGKKSTKFIKVTTISQVWCSEGWLPPQCSAYGESRETSAQDARDGSSETQCAQCMA